MAGLDRVWPLKRHCNGMATMETHHLEIASIAKMDVDPLEMTNKHFATFFRHGPVESS